jgi:hypothetical protein
MKIQNQLDPLTRRSFCEKWAKTSLGVTVLHGLGGSALAADGPGFGKAKNVIFLQMIGGMSHIDTLDPKEGDTQGPVKPVSTKAGFQLGGTMQNLAKQADKISIIRSMTSKTGACQRPVLDSQWLRAAWNDSASEHWRLGAELPRCQP